MAEYIGKYENAAAIQSAVDGGELVKPYVALDENTGMIDWNTKFIDYANMPLTFEILSDGNLYWKGDSNYITRTIEYKLNDGEWTSITSTTGDGTTITVKAGNTVQFRGNNNRYTENVNGLATSFKKSTAGFKIYGNIMSLINSTNFSTLTTLTSGYTFYNLFASCTGLTDASKLILPATTLAEGCYASMFSNSTALTTAPILPASVLTKKCYQGMFYGCRKLNYIKCLATDKSATDCTFNWADSVASTGTFVKAAGITWPTGASGIPSRWTVVEE